MLVVFNEDIQKRNVFELMVITTYQIELRQYINLYGDISFLLRYENTRALHTYGYCCIEVANQHCDHEKVRWVFY